MTSRRQYLHLLTIGVSKCQIVAKTEGVCQPGFQMSCSEKGE